MQINTDYNLVSFPQFLEECERELGTNKFQAKNYTTQKWCGGTEMLYEVQANSMAVEYTQTRVWRFHYNGTIGEGLTLVGAITDHKEKYRENYYH